MSEPTSNVTEGSASGNANPEGSRPEGATGSEPTAVPRDAYEALKKDLGLQKQKNRELESRLNELTESEKNKGKTQAEREADMARQLAETKSRYQSIFAENEARKILEPLNLHSTETAWTLLKDQVEVVEGDDGKIHLRPKDDYRSFPEFASNWVDSKAPFLKKNDRKAGTGDNGPGNHPDTGKATSVPSGFSAWSRDKQTEWMNKNPALADQVVKDIFG